MERRLNRGGGIDSPNKEGALLHIAMKQMVTGMFFARILFPTTKAYLMQKDKDRTFRKEFEVTKKLVDELKHLNQNIKPRKMELACCGRPCRRAVLSQRVGCLDGVRPGPVARGRVA